MNIEQARFNMIEQQIRPWDVAGRRRAAALGRVKREDFVPAACKGLAFMDTEIPLAGGQSMLAPRVEARLLQELRERERNEVAATSLPRGLSAAGLFYETHMWTF